MGNYNDHLMEQLADQGDGFYRYVDTYEEARATSTSTSSPHADPVADDAPAGGVRPRAGRRRYRLVGYENRAMDDDVRSTTSPSTPASSVPATTRARSTRCGWPPASPRARRSARPRPLEDPEHERARDGQRAGARRRSRGRADVGLLRAGNGRRRPRPDHPGVRRGVRTPASADDVQARAAELATRASRVRPSWRSSRRPPLGRRRQAFANHRADGIRASSYCSTADAGMIVLAVVPAVSAPGDGPPRAGALRRRPVPREPDAHASAVRSRDVPAARVLSRKAPRRLSRDLWRGRCWPPAAPVAGTPTTW